MLHLDLDQFEGAAFFCAARMLPKKRIHTLCLFCWKTQQLSRWHPSRKLAKWLCHAAFPMWFWFKAGFASFLRCAKDISTFLRNLCEALYCFVWASWLVTSRKLSWFDRVTLRHGSLGQHHPVCRDTPEPVVAHCQDQWPLGSNLPWVSTFDD